MDKLPAWLEIVPITAVSIAFIICFSLQTILVKFDDEVLHIGLVWLTALMLTAGWPMNGIFLLIDRVRTGFYSKGFSIKKHAIWIARRYVFLGLLDALHIALLSIGLTALPGSTYMILKSSNNVFNILLSRVIVGKKITWVNALSVGCITVGTIIMGLGAGHDRKSESKLLYCIAFISSIASAFMDALQAVIAQLLFTTKEERASGVKKSKELGEVLETSFWNGLISFCAILPIPFLLGRAPVWYHTIAPNSNRVIALYAIVGVGIGLSKQGGYLFKFFAVQLASALYQSLLDMLRRVVVIAFCCIVFGESFTIFKLISIVCTIIGFTAFTLGSHFAKRKASAERLVALGVDPGPPAFPLILPVRRRDPGPPRGYNTVPEEQGIDDSLVIGMSDESAGDMLV